MSPIPGKLVALGTDPSTQHCRALVGCSPQALHELAVVTLYAPVMIISAEDYAEFCALRQSAIENLQSKIP